MRGLRRGLSVIVVAALSAGPATGNDADPVLVTVGTAAVRASDVTRRLAALPPVQLRSLGASPEEIRRRYVRSVLVPELLYGEAARKRRLAGAPWVARRVREVYHRALRDEVTRETLAKAPVTDEAVAAYYGEHRAEFHKEERLLLWRILVDDRAIAERVIREGHGVGGPDRWRALAREHSRDTATHLRSGVLGFVGPDGSTDIPQVRVDPALYEAARQVADGEIVATAVPEGELLAVVWRRGTRPAMGRSLDDAREYIVDILQRRRSAEALTALLERLRKTRLREHHPELTEQLPIVEADSLVPGAPRPTAPPVPSASPRPPASEDPAPRPIEGQLR